MKDAASKFLFSSRTLKEDWDFGAGDNHAWRSRVLGFARGAEMAGRLDPFTGRR
jgi:hypothetical protein